MSKDFLVYGICIVIGLLLALYGIIMAKKQHDLPIYDRVFMKMTIYYLEIVFGLFLALLCLLNIICKQLGIA